MTKSSHTLKVTKGSKTYTCDLYGTTAEAAVYGASSYLPVNVSGTNLYAPLYPATGWTQTFYDNYGTPLHVSKGGSEYVLATHSLIRLGITAVANETITVTAGGESWTSGNKFFPYGTTWTATVKGNTGYNAGSLTPASSGTLTNANVTVTAGAASLKTYTLKVGSPAHQTVVVKYKNRNAANTGYESEQRLEEGDSKAVRHGTTWTATVTADTGWTAGSLSPASSGTVTAATTVTAGAATYKTFTLKCASTAHQTITLKYKNKKSDGTFDTEKQCAEGDSKTVGYGTTWTATISADTGYTHGTLSGTKGTVTANTTVSATAATEITPKVTITKAGEAYGFTVTYTNTSGTSVTSGNRPSSVTIKYNTKIRFNANTGSTYHDLSIKQGSTYKTTIDYTNQWTSGALTSNTTFTVTGIDNTPEGSGGEGSGGEGGA